MTNVSEVNLFTRRLLSLLTLCQNAASLHNANVSSTLALSVATGEDVKRRLAELEPSQIATVADVEAAVDLANNLAGVMSLLDSDVDISDAFEALQLDDAILAAHLALVIRINELCGGLVHQGPVAGN